MNDLPAPRHTPQTLLPEQRAGAVAQAADRAAARSRFNDYRSRRAAHTLRRQEADLSLFAGFLQDLGVPADDLARRPDGWRLITWGLVEAFIKWQLKEGYAVRTVNVRLSTVKSYARLALQSGALSPQEYALIRAILGYSLREQNRVDARRTRTRRGNKKIEPVRITPEQAAALKAQPSTPQGRRDALLLCLLLDHGLRVGETAGLLVDNIHLDEEVVRFHRPKVNKVQTHRLSADTLAALRACAAFNELPAEGPLLRRSRKNGELAEAGMGERAITARVRALGAVIGLPGLSAHDCRHYWATNAARHGTDPFDLQQAGGWSSLAMPRRYIADNDIANQGVELE
ncbi:MAG: tyrosine-type recombinase/integrase [Anaerolineae bacterium]|nr:tyrosine-type recombinase/integrase [Anaerolineae bacterium]